MKAVHCCQHLLLGVEGVQVPLRLGIPTVLSQTWGWTLVAEGVLICFWFLSLSAAPGEVC